MFYLKKFENHDEYESAKNGLYTPNVSLCVNENEVHYKRLPYDAEIDYIQCVNTAKFVTDIYFNEQTLYTCVFEFGSISSRLIPTGIYGASEDGYWGISPDGFVEVRGQNNYSNIKVSNGRHTFVRAPKVKTVDGIAVAYGGTGDSGWFNRPTYPLSIFAHQYDEDYNNNGVRFCSATVEQNGTITNLIVPVRIGQIGFLYDKKKDKLFTGTGNFILGPDKIN